MQKNLFVNKTNLLAFKDMLNKISLDENAIIIVPDKFTLNAEKMFFEQKQILANFSARVFSLTKLASLVLEENLKDKKLIDKNISLMIVSSIISENLHNFKYFKNIKDINKITEDIFNVISQMLSSSVNSFNPNLTGTLKDKFDDLNLILSAYLKRREEVLIDASQKYELFLNEIKNSSFIKNNNFYFGMFFSMTTQVKNIVKEISTYSKSVCFSGAESGNRVNNNEIIEFYKSLSPNKNAGEHKLNEVSTFIEENFFSSNTKKMETNSIKLFEANSKSEEVENLVLEIKKEVFLNGKRFKDLAVCVSSVEKYKDSLIEKFEENNINYFIDSDIKLSENSYAKFLLDFIKVLNNFNFANILSLVKSPYINFSENIKNDFEKFLFKFSLINSNLNKYECFSDDVLYKSYYFVYENFIKEVETFKNNLKNIEIRQFFNNFDKILNLIGAKEKLKEKTEYYLNNDILKYKQFRQVEEKIFDAINNICDFYKEEFSLKKVENFIKICFENTTISVPATSVDALFVGDYVNSYFIDYDTLYVLGMDSGSFPSLKQDISLFTDSELEKLENVDKIEPKLKDTNKLNYYKAFQTLLCFKNSIVLSYSLTDEKGTRQFASNIYKNFLNRFTKNNESIVKLKTSGNILEELERVEILNLLSLKLNDKSEYLKRYFSLESGKEKEVLFYILTNYYKLDEKLLKSSNFNENLIFIDKIDQKFLNFTKFSASNLEDYFACPSKFLYKNILKLNKFEPITLDARVFGNIVHDCCYYFAEEILKQKTIAKIKTNENSLENSFDNGLENVLEQNIEKQEKWDNIDFSKINKNEIICRVLNSNKYKNYKNLENSEQILNNLVEEIKKLFVFIENQQKNSEFKLSHAEFRFEKELDGVIFKGAVDRIDETEDEFIVIDYKTGSTKIKYDEIVFCKKIQLILYAKILEKVLNKKCAGIYYLSVSDDFSTTNKLKIYLNGITKNSDNLVHKLDNESYFEKTYKSNFFEFDKKYLLNSSEFENLLNKTYKKVLSAIKSVKQGEFQNSPLVLNEKSACEYCDYMEICKTKCENKVEFTDEMLEELLKDES